MGIELQLETFFWRVRSGRIDATASPDMERGAANVFR
jgi:hypothetical protein